jgi:hypothetical protein
MSAVLSFPKSCDRETAATADTIAPAAKRRTLGDYLSGVDAIIDTVESLDAEDLSDVDRDELSQMLIAELAGTRKKVDATNAALATWEGLEASAAREIERLDARRKRYARLRESLELYVLAILEASHLTKIEGDISTLTKRNNPPSVRVDDAAAVPMQYLRFPPQPAAVPDKTAIAKALKADEEVPGCRLVQTARLVRS